ncbi:hypothetical protein [Spirosoma oryzicola]|uniref:hypothetical protein n=1 Tax=Spirosoma oryzicola TaxID=2898794 RepID=UPI001E61573A|nr:hypothetical protein [Spirosoma oryzicola]UHG91758.1 hypothetical protein LQ777_02400 [Spirosoma oryzicola]
MEPLTIAAVVGYLAKTLKENKAFKDFTSDFTEATVNWIRPVFLENDNTPNDLLKKLEQNPDSEARKKAAEAAIAVEVEDNPQLIKLLEEMYSVIKSKQSTGSTTTVTNSKNVNTGTVTAGTSVTFGDTK